MSPIHLYDSEYIICGSKIVINNETAPYHKAKCHQAPKNAAFHGVEMSPIHFNGNRFPFALSKYR